MKSYTLYLFRHGLTKGNINAQYIGHTDYPLTTFGINELKEIYKKQDIYFVDFFCFVDKLKIDKTSLLLSIKELGSNISFVDWI